MLKHVLRRRAYPGDDRQEGEGQNSPGGIPYDIWTCRGTGPLAGQDTEADEPQERPHRCEEKEKYAALPVLWAEFLYCCMSNLQWKQSLTWKGQITYNNKLSFLGIADLREVCIQYDEDTTSQKGQYSYSDSIVAGTVVFIEHALGILLGLFVNVPFCRNGCKHHNGE